MEQVLPEVANIRTEAATLASCPAKTVQYTTNLQGSQIKFLQSFTLKDNFAYIVTFSAPVATHDGYKELMEKCTATFKLIEKKGVSSLQLSPYFNKTYHYHLRFPNGWAKTDVKGSSAVRFEYKKGKSKDVLLHLVVAVDEVPAKTTLAQYSTLLTAQISESRKHGATPIETEDAKLGGIAAKSTTFYSDALRYPGHYYMIWALKDDHAYTLTFVTSVEETVNDIAFYKPIFDRVVSLFRFASPDDLVDTSMRYENLGLKFAIHYTDKLAPSEGFMGSTITFTAPESFGGSFPTNLNVVVQDMSGQSMSLDEFSAMLKDQLEYTVQNCEILGVSEVEVAGSPGREFKYEGKVENHKVKFVQHVAVVGGKAIVLSLASEKDKFEQEYRTIGKYMKTFTLL